MIECNICGLLKGDIFGCWGHELNVSPFGYVPPEDFPWEEARFFSVGGWLERDFKEGDKLPLGLIIHAEINPDNLFKENFEGTDWSFAFSNKLLGTSVQERPDKYFWTEASPAFTKKLISAGMINVRNC